jgi:S-adenosyl methyltransferase
MTTDFEFYIVAVRYMISKGISQLIDICPGTPLETNNTHEVAEPMECNIRTMYVVDGLSSVLRWGARIAGMRSVFVIQTDFRHLDIMFENPDVANRLNLSTPVGILLRERSSIAMDLLRAVPKGSYIATIHHGEKELVRKDSAHIEGFPYPEYVSLNTKREVGEQQTREHQQTSS